MKAIVRAGVTAAALLLPAVASAQFIWRPDAEWRTLETGHFIVHYPREFARWTLDMAEQLESVRSAVGREVGSVPAERVTVMVTGPPHLRCRPRPAWQRSQRQGSGRVRDESGRVRPERMKRTLQDTPGAKRMTSGSAGAE